MRFNTLFLICLISWTYSSFGQGNIIIDSIKSRDIEFYRLKTAEEANLIIQSGEQEKSKAPITTVVPVGFGEHLLAYVRLEKSELLNNLPASLFLFFEGLEIDNLKIQSGKPTITSQNDTIINAIYTFNLPAKIIKRLENNAPIDGFSDLWKATYVVGKSNWTRGAIIKNYEGNNTINLEIKKGKNIKLSFFNPWLMWLFLLLVLFLYVFSLFPNANLLRDNVVCEVNNSSKNHTTINNKKNSTFSLSRFQLWLWTLTIFSGMVVIWAVTEKVPDLTINHLAIFGISAATLIISTNIDKPRSNGGNIYIKRRNTGDGRGCSQGFFIDLISDTTDTPSITRLQYLTATFIFIIIFIYNIAMDFVLPDISVTQLALMGLSSVIELLRKNYERESLEDRNETSPIAQSAER